MERAVNVRGDGDDDNGAGCMVTVLVLAVVVDKIISTVVPIFIPLSNDTYEYHSRLSLRYPSEVFPLAEKCLKCSVIVVMV
jgi:hypothetical protein